MARVAKFTRPDGQPFYVNPEQLIFVTPAVTGDGTEIMTADGHLQVVQDPIENVIGAWKD